MSVKVTICPTTAAAPPVATVPETVCTPVLLGTGALVMARLGGRYLHELEAEIASSDSQCTRQTEAEVCMCSQSASLALFWGNPQQLIDVAKRYEEQSII
ncbi:hypothetical protein [Bradyrhizobium liaoningense]|uniref:hypothetical protein n=1 Tax=Bradyrhizobium liaoningense TaxID=43992 RepID=UPI001BAA121E|nr:hypothetical protein [Bradyrhizobium liaoningense]MBR0984286.1 hypothetical protein [Bradyrhizobium liaoningense]